MRLIAHAAGSGAVSAGLYAATGSLDMAAASFTAGVLLDLDHFIDYWFDHSFNLDVRRFFDVCHACEFTKTRLILHSAELLALAAAAAYITRSAVITGLALGICQHLAFDQLVNRVYPSSYLFTRRWLDGFRVERVFNVTGGEKEGGNGND